LVSLEKRISVGKFIVIILILCLLTALPVILIRHASADPAQETNAQASSEETSSAPETPLQKYGKLNDIRIRLTFDRSTETLDIKTIGDWVSVSRKGDQYTYTTDDEKIKRYTKALADKYSNYHAYVTFKTHDDEEITLPSNSTGWIFDDSYAASMIKKYITEARSANLNLTDKSAESNKWWIRISSDYNAEKKQGNSYAEVSISSQYMWLYQNGEVIMEGPVVTGNPNYGNDTPAGAYFIYEKESPAILYGPGYLTEVSYWMAFNDDIGFHDATWQDSFGGDTYLDNGSHGCVNLPLSFAEELYSSVYLYMPVYVY